MGGSESSFQRSPTSTPPPPGTMKIKVNRYLPNAALSGRAVLQSTPTAPLPPPTLLAKLDNAPSIPKTRSNNTFTRGSPMTDQNVPNSLTKPASTQTLPESETGLDTPLREGASSDPLFGEDNGLPQILQALELRVGTPNNLMDTEILETSNAEVLDINENRNSAQTKFSGNQNSGKGDDPVETKNVRRKRRRSHRKILFTLSQSTRKRPGKYLKRYAKKLEIMNKEIKKATQRTSRVSISEKIIRIGELEGHLSLMHDDLRRLKVKQTQDIEYLLLQEELLSKVEDAIEKLREEISVGERNLRLLQSQGVKKTRKVR